MDLQEQAGRVAITTCAYNTDGTQIAAGLRDGSLQLWDARGFPHLPMFHTHVASHVRWLSFRPGSASSDLAFL